MIVELESETLRHGDLAKVFRGGARAVVLKGLNIRRIGNDFVEDRREVLPWEARLVDIARNYHGHGDITTSLGDVFYFQPGHHGYIARKIKVGRDPAGNVDTFPKSFVQAGGEHSPGVRSIESCCQVVDQIADALGIETGTRPPYKVAIQRLKYQKRVEDFERLADVAANSLGR